MPVVRFHRAHTLLHAERHFLGKDADMSEA